MPVRISVLTPLVALGDQAVSVSVVVFSFICGVVLEILNTLICVQYKRSFKRSWRALKKWWSQNFIVAVDDHEEVEKFLDFIVGLEEKKRKMTFLKPFQHLKPAELKRSRSNIDRIVNDLVHEAIEKSDDIKNVTNDEIRNMQKFLKDKDISKNDDESGFFDDESISHRSVL